MPARHGSARCVRFTLLALCAVAYLGLGAWVASRWFADARPARTGLRTHSSAQRMATRREAREHIAAAAREQPRDHSPFDNGEALGDDELAAATLEDLRARTATFHASMAVPDDVLAVQSQHEAIAQTLHDILERSPDAESAFAEETERLLCDRSSSHLDLLLAAKIALRLPDAPLERGLGCLLERNTLKGELVENDVLWSALDLWQASGRPAPPSLLALSRRTTDARTLRRLARDDRDVGNTQHAVRARSAFPGE